VRRRTAAVFAAALVAGCGSSGEKVSPRSVVRAAEKTRDTSGFRLAMRSSIRFPGLDRPLSLPTTGVLDARRQRGTLTADMSELIKASSGKVGDYRAKQVLDGDVSYTNAPWLAKQAHGKTWIKAAVGGETGPVGSPLDRPLFGQIQQAPLHLIDQLRFLRGSAERLGRESVRGTPATHYRVTVDLERWSRDPSAFDAAGARFVGGRFTAITGRSDYPADVWVDRGGLVRRVAFHLSFASKQIPGRPKIDFRESLDVYDFGVPVTIHPPEARQIAKDVGG
jgi:hypothetical protein